MAIQTKLPNTTLLQGDWVRTGGTSVHNALADESDTNYMIGPNDRVNQYMRVGFEDYTIPANTRIRRVRAKWRGIINSKQELRVRFYAHVIKKWTTPTHLQGALGGGTYTKTSHWWEKAPDGSEWGQTDINNSYLEFWDNSYLTTSSGGDGPKLTWAKVEIETNVRPVVSNVVVEGESAGVLGSTTLPTVTWDYTDTDNDPEHRFEVAAFRSDQYGISGFNPATAEAEYRTVAFGPATGHIFDKNLQNGQTYRIYVRASQTFLGGEWWSDWAFKQFTISLSPPAKPEASLVSLVASYLNRVTVKGYINLLLEEDAGFPTTIGTWGAVGGTTGAPVRVTTPAPPAGQGVGVLQVTANGTGFLLFRTSETPGQFTTNIVPGKTYEVSAWFRGNTTTGAAHLRIIALRADGTEVSIGGSGSTNFVSGSWTLISNEIVMPSGAVGMAMYVQISNSGGSGNPANGTIFFMAAPQVVPIDGTYAGTVPWSRGGLETITTYDLEYADAPYYGDIAPDNIRTGGDEEQSVNGYYPRAGESVTVSNEVTSHIYHIRWVTPAVAAPVLDVGFSSLGSPRLLTGYTFIPAVGSTYEIKVRLRKRDTVDSVTLQVRVVWCDGAGNDLSNVITSAMAVDGNVMTDYSTGIITPHASTVTARVELVLAQPAAGGQVIFIESVNFIRTNTAGLAEAPEVSNPPLEFVDHRLGRDFQLGMHQTLRLEDYEAPPHKTRVYRVRAVSTVSEQQVASAYTAWMQAGPLPLPAAPRQRWVVKDPTAPAGTIVEVIAIEDSWIETARPVHAGRYAPRNSTKEIVVKNSPTGLVTAVTVVTLDEAKHARLLRMFYSTRTLLLVGPRQQLWVDVIGDLAARRHMWDESDGVARRTTWSLVEVEAPRADV